MKQNKEITILVVDDSSTMRRIICNILSKTLDNSETIEAEDGVFINN